MNGIDMVVQSGLGTIKKIDFFPDNSINSNKKGWSRKVCRKR